MLNTMMLVISTAVWAAGPLGMPDIDITTDSTAIAIRVMQIDVWPEYDKPEVLVIYQGELEKPSSLPVQFKLRIPRNAQVHMAGGIGPDGRHLHAVYTVQPIGDDLDEITYELTSKTFYMEFYYDPLGNGDRRSFSYPVISPYPIGQLVVQVQEPAGAEDFVLSPTASDITSDQQGLRYYRLGFENVLRDSLMNLQIAYVKNDHEPSVAASGAVDESERGTMRAVAITSVFLLIGALGLGVVLSWRSRRRIAPGSGSQRQRVKTGRKVDSKGYCTSCGSRLDEGDVFCGACGQSVKSRSDVPVMHR